MIAGSGIFVGGSAPLSAGSRYGLVVTQTRLNIVGPIDTAPERVVVSRPLGSIDATVLGDRLLVSGIGDDRGRFVVAFQHLAGVTAVDLEEALTASSRSVGSRRNGQ